MALTTLVTLLAACGTASALTAGSVAPHVMKSAASVSSAIRMGVPVADFEGSKTSEADVSLKIAKSGAYLLQRKVVVEQANMRLGTACTKTRSDVRGGGRKPYKQKGTGRARRGSTRSPLIKGGGVSFGPKPKSYSLKINRKEGQLAISTALMSALPKMTVVEDFADKFSSPKTSEMKSFLDRLNVNTKDQESTLMVIKEKDENTYLSAKNIPYLNLMSLDNINVRDILKAKKVFVSKSALDELNQRYGA